MSYEQSIRAINIAQTLYFRLCQLALAETDDSIGEALELLHRLKTAHKARFLTLTRVDGEWI